MRWTIALFAVTAASLLAACGPQGPEAGPGEVTVGEARALDEAAEMLDERRDPRERPPTPAEGKPGQTARQD